MTDYDALCARLRDYASSGHPACCVEAVTAIAALVARVAELEAALAPAPAPAPTGKSWIADLLAAHPAPAPEAQVPYTEGEEYARFMRQLRRDEG